MDKPSDLFKAQEPQVESEEKKSPQPEGKELITDLDQAIELLSIASQIDAKEELSQVDASLHPVLFKKMMAFEGPVSVTALNNIYSFSGIDYHKELEQIMKSSLVIYMWNELQRFSDVDVLELADATIAQRRQGGLSHMMHFAEKVDAKYHDQIAQKIINAGGSHASLFEIDERDETKKIGFEGLSLETLRLLYEQIKQRPNRAGAVIDEHKAEVAAKSLRRDFGHVVNYYISQFSVTGEELADFLLAEDMGDLFVHAALSVPGPYGVEGSRYLLEHGSEPVQERVLARLGESDSIGAQEAFAFMWETKRRRKIVAERLVHFFDVLPEGTITDDVLRQLIAEGNKQQVGEMLITVSVDPKEVIAQRLYDLGLSSVVMSEKIRFGGHVDDEELLDHLIADGEKQLIMNNLVMDEEMFGRKRTLHERRKMLVRPGATAKKLLDADMNMIVAARLRMFGSAVDRNDLAGRLIDTHDQAVAENKTHPSRRARPDFSSSPLMKFFPQFKELDDEVMLEIIKRGGGFKVLPRLFQDHKESSANEEQTHLQQEGGTMFGNLDQHEVLEGLFASEDFATISQFIDKFDSSIDRNQVVQKVVERNGGGDILLHLSKLTGLSNETAELLFNSAESYAGSYIAKSPESFDELSASVVSRVVRGVIAEGDMTSAVEFNEANGSPNQVLARLYKAFGGQFSAKIYEKAHVQARVRRERDPDAQKRARKDAAKRLNNFVNELRGLRHKFIAGHIEKEDFEQQRDLKLSWFASIVRYEDSEWGEHDLESLERLKDDYFELVERGDILEAPGPYHYPSPVLQIGRLGQHEKEKEEFEFSDGFLSRYKQLKDSIQQAHFRVTESKALYQRRKELAEQKGVPQALDAIVDDIKRKQTKLLEKLHEKKLTVAINARERGGDPVRAAAGLQRRIDVLESVQLDSVSEPQKIFNILSSFKGEFEDELRQLMFYMAFVKHENQMDIEWWLFDDEPTPGELSKVINFVDHITNQETVGELFTDKKAIKNFRGMLNTTALDVERKRWQAHRYDTDGTQGLQVRCQRNLLTEVSGHLGDACWANKIPSILKAHPNFISFTYTVNPDDPQHEKFVGAGFLIETKAKDGTPTLVIRGNNPIESYANSVDVLDFLYQTLQYFERKASARGMKLAVVIDHAGGAGTNRPAVQDVYDQLKSMLPKVELASNLDTQFNGYDIRRDAYAITSEDIVRLRETMGGVID